MSVVAGGACSSGGPEDVGSAQMSLELAGGVTIAAAAYTITGPNGFTRTGSIDVSHSNTLSAIIGPLPAGTGYSISVTASSTDGGLSCLGSATFDVVAHKTVDVSVHLLCHQAPGNGSVFVNGTLNVCPQIDSISASPAEVFVGGSIALSGAAHDKDAGPAPLRYRWSAKSGALDDAESSNPEFTCTTAGPVTVTLTVSDGDPAPGCVDTGEVTIRCTPLDPAAAKAWRTSMVSTPLPNAGCFRASYPSLLWQAVPCTTAPQTPFGPPTPQVVGNGADFSAVSAGHISQAVGSFDSITGLVSSDSTATGGVGPFSLQLNTNTFPTSSCGDGCGACGGNACTGWQQFVFDDDSRPFRSPSAYMQYWLVGFAGACPPGWNMAPGFGCFRNSNAVGIPVAIVPGANLAQTSVVGRTTATMDTFILSTTGGDLTAVGADNVVGLQAGWNAAEFNVFGDGNGSTAAFNTGSTIVVRTSITDGTTNAPACPAGSGTTGELNSLNLIGPCCTIPGAEPAIVFTESDVPGAMSTCPGGACTPGQKVLADTILSTGANCFGSSNAGDFGQATCDPGFTLGTCSATFVNDGSDNGSTCTATPTGGCGCHVVATSPRDCGKAVNCHVLVTEQPIAGPVPQIVTNQTGHNGSDCFGTSHDYDFPAACDAGFTLGTCSAHLITDPNGSTCTATPIGDCGCRLHVTTPSDCVKFASCSVIATEVPTTWGGSCSSLDRF
jgi:hypothetical protein